MKLRFFIYGSLLFVALALPVVYHMMNVNIQEQETAIWKQREIWYFKMADSEFDLAHSADNADSFWFHYIKGCNYALLEFEMIRQDWDRISENLNF